MRGGRLGVVGIVFYVFAAASPAGGHDRRAAGRDRLGQRRRRARRVRRRRHRAAAVQRRLRGHGHRVTNAGAFFAYVGRGLGIGPGVGAPSRLAGLLASSSPIYGFFGAVMGGKMNAEFGVDLSWWVWSLLAWAVVLLLSVFSVDVGAKVLGVLMTLELASLVLMAVAVFVKAAVPRASTSVPRSRRATCWSVDSPALPASRWRSRSPRSSGSRPPPSTARSPGPEAEGPVRDVPRRRRDHRDLRDDHLGGGPALGAAPWSTRQSAVLGRRRTAGRLRAGDLLRRRRVRRGLARPRHELAGAQQPVRRLLAFQNSAARYVYSMGRAGVLPSQLDRFNTAGAPADRLGRDLRGDRRR